jgi:hypothetical protein
VTAVQDRLVTSLQEAKQFLGIDPSDTSQDLMIKLAISAGKQAADAYMQNPFLQRNQNIDFDDLVYWEGNDIDNDPDVVDIGRNIDRSRFSRSGHVLPQKYQEPNVELPIPDMVKIGVYKFVQLTMDGAPEGVARERIGDWQRDYIAFVSNTDRAAFIKSTYWQQWRLSPGL